MIEEQHRKQFFLVGQVLALLSALSFLKGGGEVGGPLVCLGALRPPGRFKTRHNIGPTHNQAVGPTYALHIYLLV